MPAGKTMKLISWQHLATRASVQQAEEFCFWRTRSLGFWGERSLVLHLEMKTVPEDFFQLYWAILDKKYVFIFQFGHNALSMRDLSFPRPRDQQPVLPALEVQVLATRPQEVIKFKILKVYHIQRFKTGKHFHCEKVSLSSKLTHLSASSIYFVNFWVRCLESLNLSNLIT